MRHALATVTLLLGCSSARTPAGVGGADAARDEGVPDALPPHLTKGAGAEWGVVAGFVVEDESEVPLPAAQVRVNDGLAGLDVDGSFSVIGRMGRAYVEVRAVGHLDTFRAMVAGREGLLVPFRLPRRAPPQLVTALGGTFTFRETTVTVPAGAFAGDTPVSLTYLSRGRVAAFASSPQFIDRYGIPRRAIALIDLAIDHRAAKLLRVRVPVPADATVDTVATFSITRGEWGIPLPPEAVAGGFAELTVVDTEQIGLAIDVRAADGSRPGYLLAEGCDERPGAVLAAGTELVAGLRPCALVDGLGARYELAPGTQVRLADLGPDEPTSSSARYGGRIDLLAGQVRVATAGAPRIAATIEGQHAIVTAGSAAFSVSTCGNGADAVDFVDVFDGQVTAATATDRLEIAGGESATVCGSCVGRSCLPGSDGGAP
jgi:hypothetical protein